MRYGRTKSRTTKRRSGCCTPPAIPRPRSPVGHVRTCSCPHSSSSPLRHCAACENGGSMPFFEAAHLPSTVVHAPGLALLLLLLLLPLRLGRRCAVSFALPLHRAYAAFHGLGILWLTTPHGSARFCLGRRAVYMMSAVPTRSCGHSVMV